MKDSSIPSRYRWGYFIGTLFLLSPVLFGSGCAMGERLRIDEEELALLRTAPSVRVAHVLPAYSIAEIRHYRMSKWSKDAKLIENRWLPLESAKLTTEVRDQFLKGISRFLGSAPVTIAPEPMKQQAIETMTGSEPVFVFELLRWNLQWQKNEEELFKYESQSGMLSLDLRVTLSIPSKNRILYEKTCRIQKKDVAVEGRGVLELKNREDFVRIHSLLNDPAEQSLRQELAGICAKSLAESFHP